MSNPRIITASIYSNDSFLWQLPCPVTFITSDEIYPILKSASGGETKTYVLIDPVKPVDPQPERGRHS